MIICHILFTSNFTIFKVVTQANNVTPFMLFAPMCTQTLPKAENFMCRKFPNKLKLKFMKVSSFTINCKTNPPTYKVQPIYEPFF